MGFYYSIAATNRTVVFHKFCGWLLICPCWLLSSTFGQANLCGSNCTKTHVSSDLFQTIFPILNFDFTELISFSVEGHFQAAVGLESLDQLLATMACSANHSKGSGSAVGAGLIVGQPGWLQRKIHLRPQHRGVHLVTEEILRQVIKANNCQATSAAIKFCEIRTYTYAYIVSKLSHNLLLRISRIFQ